MEGISKGAFSIKNGIQNGKGLDLGPKRNLPRPPRKKNVFVSGEIFTTQSFYAPPCPNIRAYNVGVGCSKAN